MLSFGGMSGGGQRPLGQMWPQQPMQQHPSGQLPAMGQFPTNPGQMSPGGGGTGSPPQMGQMSQQQMRSGYGAPQRQMGQQGLGFMQQAMANHPDWQSRLQGFMQQYPQFAQQYPQLGGMLPNFMGQ